MDLQFEWRAAIQRDDRDTLRLAIVEGCKHLGSTGEEPALVIVAPATFDPYDERLIVEIQSNSGKVLYGGPLELRKK